MNVGNVIADWRRRRNLRQNKLAEKTGIPVSVLSKIENGKRMPNPNHLKKISDALNLPEQIIVFLSMDNSDKIPIEKRDEFEKAYRDFKFLVEKTFD